MTKDPEKKRAYDRNYRRKRYADTPEIVKAGVRAWRKANRVKTRAWDTRYAKARRGVDLNFRMRYRLRSRLLKALKGELKTSSTMELLGCSIPFLLQFIEKQFQPGMTWENHGEWHLDHVRPCASFNLSDPEQQKRCFHFSNLQPLWAIDNLKKSDKF